MTKNLKAAALVAVIAATLAIPSAAIAVEYPAYSAGCDVSDNQSTFTANKKGFYSYVWRTGNTINGYNVRYLTAGETFSPTNPSGVTTSTRFGVVTGSRAFAYVTCAA